MSSLHSNIFKETNVVDMLVINSQQSKVRFKLCDISWTWSIVHSFYLPRHMIEPIFLSDILSSTMNLHFALLCSKTHILILHTSSKALRLLRYQGM